MWITRRSRPTRRRLGRPIWRPTNKGCQPGALGAVRAARRLDRTNRTRPLLLVESESHSLTARGSGEEKVLAVTHQTATPSAMSSPTTSYYLSPETSMAGAPDTPPIPAMCVQDRTGDHGRTAGSHSPAGNFLYRRRAVSASIPRTEKRSAPSFSILFCGPSFWWHERQITRSYASGGASVQAPRSTAESLPLGKTSV